MLLDYARTRSDATVQKEGSAEEFEVHRRRRLAEKGMDILAAWFMRTQKQADHYGNQRESKRTRLQRPRKN